MADAREKRRVDREVKAGRERAAQERAAAHGRKEKEEDEEVMAEPNRAEELLCRQNPEWKDEPWQEV